MFSRRDLGKAALGALALPAMAARKIDSVVHGIQFGLQSYVFTGIGLPQESLVDTVIESMVESGLGECDFYTRLLEGGALAPMETFQSVRKKFDDAGIEIYGLSGFPGSNQEELTRTFAVARILGARRITLGVTLPAAKLIVPLVEASGFEIGIQGGPNMNSTRPDAISRPEQYEEAVSLSKSYSMSFDIGDATGGGYDALQFVKTHHDRIGLLYLKDRRKDRLSMAWGEGETPVAEILKLVRDGKYPIRCYLDCDYKTTDRKSDVKRSFAYAKAALGS
jgi:sugar phosphate isomerase/epimerase